MKIEDQIVIGVDVGGRSKGFHAVALTQGTFRKTRFSEPQEVALWCAEHQASVVAVDAPCCWSCSGSSRLAERELSKESIFCFATPTRAVAKNHKKGFYAWVFSGEAVYRALGNAGYPLFDGKRSGQRICLETFPHAIVCALIGKTISAKPKSSSRRKVLTDLGYEVQSLSNIDFIDAALCAVAAREHAQGRTRTFGNSSEGFIVVPASKWYLPSTDDC